MVLMSEQVALRTVSLSVWNGRVCISRTINSRVSKNKKKSQGPRSSLYRFTLKDIRKKEIGPWDDIRSPAHVGGKASNNQMSGALANRASAYVSELMFEMARLR